ATPDAAPLDRVARGRVHGRPALAAVVRVRDVQVPDARERLRLVIAGTRRSEEREGGAVIVACDDLGELRVLDAVRNANVRRRRPRLSVVVAHCDARMAVTGFVAVVDAVPGSDSDRRVGTVVHRLRRAVRDDRVAPRLAVVRTHGHALTLYAVGPLAAVLRDVHRAVGPDFDMPGDRTARGCRAEQLRADVVRDAAA